MMSWYLGLMKVFYLLAIMQFIKGAAVILFCLYWKL